MATSMKKRTLLLCVVASQATMLFSFGYDTVVLLLATTTTMEADLELTEDQARHFRNDIKWVFFLACLASGFSADFLGRRSTLILSGALSCLGFLTTSLAISYGVLVTGRVLTLAGLGLGLPVAPLYIGEISSPGRRGCLVSITEIFWCLGQFLALVTRAAVRDWSARAQWRGLLGVGIFPSLVLGVVMILMPESPSWLVRRARVADAKSVLQKTLKTFDEVDERLSALRTAARIPSTIGDENFEAIPQDIRLLAIWQEFRRPATRFSLKLLFLSNLTPHLIQQATGIDLLTFDSLVTSRLHDSHAPMDFLLDQLPFLFARMLPILLPICVSDIIGRRRLLWLSLVLITLAMVPMNISLMAMDHHIMFDSGVAERMNGWSTALVFGSFSVGLGPITWVHTSEVLPFKVRAQLIGITVAANRLASLGLNFLHQTMNRWSTDVLYLVLNVVLPYVGQRLFRKYLIETRGDSLESTDEIISPTIELHQGPFAAFNF